MGVCGNWGQVPTVNTASVSVDRGLSVSPCLHNAFCSTEASGEVRANNSRRRRLGPKVPRRAKSVAYMHERRTEYMRIFTRPLADLLHAIQARVKFQEFKTEETKLSMYLKYSSNSSIGLW